MSRADGSRCGLGCSSSTTTPAVVFFPYDYSSTHLFVGLTDCQNRTGNYLISKPIISYYYTTLLGDAKNPLTLTMAAAFSNDGTGYNCAIEADPYIPGGNGANYWQNQNNCAFRPRLGRREADPCASQSSGASATLLSTPLPSRRPRKRLGFIGRLHRLLHSRRSRSRCRPPRAPSTPGSLRPNLQTCERES